jgi:hypothetical protein
MTQIQKWIPEDERYYLYCDCTQLLCADQEFLVGYYPSLEEAAEAYHNHKRWHTRRYAGYGQKYCIHHLLDYWREEQIPPVSV